MKGWYRLQNAASDPSVAEIHIIDFIGDWIDDWIKELYGDSSPVTAKSFIDELSKLPDTVKSLHIHINSPGGDVQGGINIANALREQASKGRTVETFIDGIAASIASVIAMAGSKVHIADNALVMVHNPWSIAIGNAGEMRKTADILDTIRTQIINTYKWHSPLDDKQLEKLMDAETWMDADEAIANGFATDKVEGLKAAAALDARAMARMSVPDKYRARVEALVKIPAPAPEPPKAAGALDVLRTCEAASCLDMAAALIAERATLEAVNERVGAERARRAAAVARETSIRALCDRATLPDLAASYIDGGMSVAAVQAQLTTITAKLDRVEIDGGLHPDAGAPKKARLDHAAIYATYNNTKQKE